MIEITAVRDMDFLKNKNEELDKIQEKLLTTLYQLDTDNDKNIEALKKKLDELYKRREEIGNLMNEISGWDVNK